MDAWKMEVDKFTDEDELFKLDGKVAKAAAESIVPFYCFEEDWERDVIVTKCNTNQHKLRIKYYGICFQDDDVEKMDNKNKKFRVTEVRKVVNVEWSSKQRPSQHVLVTQLVNSDNKDTLEPYWINQTFFQMIDNCTDNYNASRKIITDERNTTI